jgi:hypothetical protein
MYRKKGGSGIEPFIFCGLRVEALGRMEMTDMRRIGWDLVKLKMLALSSGIAKLSLYSVSFLNITGDITYCRTLPTSHKTSCHSGPVRSTTKAL